MRDDRKALLLAAGETIGVVPGTVAETEALEHRQTLGASLRLEHSLRWTAPRITLSSTLRCGNRLKAWKTMPSRRRTGTGSMPGTVMALTVEQDVAVVDLLEQVHAAQQCRLTRPRCPDQRHRLMLVHDEVDATQDPWDP